MLKTPLYQNYVVIMIKIVPELIIPGGDLCNDCIRTLKGTLHFKNNLGSKDSLDPPK